MPSDAQVLIVGAGPTGLTAASELTRHGVRVRIVEQNPGPSIHCKALVVQPRTLEVFYAMGIAEQALTAAQPVFHIQAYLSGKGMPMIQFGEVDGPFPRPVMLRQSQTERILGARLEQQGVAIEWGKPLVELEAARRRDLSVHPDPPPATRRRARPADAGAAWVRRRAAARQLSRRSPPDRRRRAALHRPRVSDRARGRQRAPLAATDPAAQVARQSPGPEQGHADHGAAGDQRPQQPDRRGATAARG